MSAGSEPLLATSRHRGVLTPRPHGPRPPRPWYRRRRSYALAAVVVVVASVLTDRYDNYTPPQRDATLTAFYSGLVTDLQTCDDGLSLTLQRWHHLTPAAAGAPTPSAVAATARIAEADCTPTNSDIYTLQTTEIPGSLVHYPQLNVALYQLGLWAYPNTARVLLAIETLAVHPGDPTARAEYAQARSTMRADLRQIDSILERVAVDLGGHLAPLPLAQP